MVGFEFKEAKIIEYLQRHIAKASMEFASKLAAELEESKQKK